MAAALSSSFQHRRLFASPTIYLYPAPWDIPGDRDRQFVSAWQARQPALRKQLLADHRELESSHGGSDHRYPLAPCGLLLAGKAPDMRAARIWFRLEDSAPCVAAAACWALRRA